MESDVANLAADSGALVRVTGTKAPGGGYASLEFEFGSGVLTLRCNDDTDEIIVEAYSGASSADGIAETWVEDLLGKWIECAWDLHNHGGYNDAFQLRFLGRERDEEVRQFEVAASAIRVSLVVSGGVAA